MAIRKKQLTNFGLILFIYLFNLNNALINKSKNNRFRKLWDEEIKYDSSGRSSEEKESLEKCENSDYKYFIHFVTGNNVTFEKYVNKDNAVKINYIILL